MTEFVSRILVFNYAKGQHTVVEVSAADYLACSAANPLGSDSSGASTVPLKTARSEERRVGKECLL